MILNLRTANYCVIFWTDDTYLLVLFNDSFNLSYNEVCNIVHYVTLSLSTLTTTLTTLPYFYLLPNLTTCGTRTLT